MTDPTIPRTNRIRAGHYRMECGESQVQIYRHRGSWKAETFERGGSAPGASERHAFRTKAEASEWAYDWLADRA